MADEETEKKDTTTTGDGTGTNAGKDEQKKGGDPNSEKTFTRERVEEIVKERLDQAERKAAKATAKAREEAEQKALTEQGEYKKLAEQRAKQLADLEPLSEQVKAANERVARYAQTLEKYRDTQFKQVPDPIKALLAKMDIVEQMEWLNANAQSAAIQPLNTNAVNTGKGNSEAAQKEREAELKRKYPSITRR